MTSEANTSSTATHAPGDERSVSDVPSPTPATSKADRHADMMRRRVLPLAAFAREVASGKKPTAAVCKRLYGSPVVPIPIPLAEGESEAEFEAKFDAWLATKSSKSKDVKKQSDPERERIVRYTYAVNLARAYSTTNPEQQTLNDRGRELEEGEEVEDGMRLSTATSTTGGSHASPAIPAAASKTSRHADMLRRRVLPLAAFAQEVAAGNTKPSGAECMRLYGSTVVPIPVPLAEGESEAEFEAKFIASQAEKGIKVEELSKHADPNRERTVRYTYAVKLVMAFNKSARKLISKVEEKDEAGDVKNEKTGKQGGRENEDRLSRDIPTAKVIVTLDQYRDDVKSERYANLGSMSTREKMRLCASSAVPILVPLAPSETPQQYEERFTEWLKRKKGLILEGLRVPTLERYMRPQFAQLNGTGAEKFVVAASSSKKRPLQTVEGGLQNKPKKEEILEKMLQDTPKPEAKKTKLEEALQGKLQVAPTAKTVNDCGGANSVDECGLCQCRRCLVRSMQLLSERVTEWEQDHSSERITDMMDLTQGADESTDDEDSAAARSNLQHPRINDDSVIKALCLTYDEVNEVIAMNEKVLDIEANHVASIALSTNVREVTRLQRENDELRELIESEYDRRRVAVAMAVTYALRHNKIELIRIVQDPSASDISHVQRSIHRRCANVASEIAKLELVHEQDSKTTLSIEELKRQRWRQFCTLVHFDKIVRNTIKSVIAQSSV